MLQVVMLLICRDGDVEAHAWSRLVGKNGNGLLDNLLPFRRFLRLSSSR
jgi:hypothetical protein